MGLRTSIPPLPGIARTLLAGACLAAAASFAADGDAEAGRALVATCAACHGADGNSALPINPSLAGQNARYLLRQMQLIRDGARAAPLMAGQLDGKTDAQLADIAAYYEAQTPDIGQAPPEASGLGQQIYRGGILDKQVAACTACHAPDGSGNALAGFPRVAGQSVDYVVEQLTAYREGERTTDEEYGAMMRQTAARLTDREIRAVADYLLGLH